MRKSLLLVLGTTAMMPFAALGQTMQNPQPSPTAGDCDRLIGMLQQHEVANPPVTVDQAQGFKRSNDFEACHVNLQKTTAALNGNRTPQTGMAQNGQDATQITLQRGAPTVKVSEGAPQVRVHEPQPNVTVNQPRPDITVHQPAPTVTVDIPQPEITVHMPNPQVNVAMAPPQVDVDQPKPNVQVVQPAQPKLQVQSAQPDVQVQQAQQQPNVSVQDNNQQPNVHYTSEQPKVVVNQAKGAPKVNYEQTSANPANATLPNGSQNAAMNNTALNSQAPDNNRSTPMNTADLPVPNPPTAPMSSIQASRIVNMNVMNAKGNTLGDVEQVVHRNSDNKNYVVMGHGGFLGLGQKHVALPIESMFLRNNELVMRGLTDDEIRAMPSWSNSDGDYKQLTGAQTVKVDTSA